MSNVGSWDVNISQNMPQKVATAVAAMNERFGIEVEPIAYIGSQQVNGILHAVLVKERVVLGKDQILVNLVKFLETKDGIAEIANDSVIVAGAELGGIQIDPKFGDDIPEDATAAFDKMFYAFVGSKITPIALITSQVVKGINYTFLVEVAPVVENPITTPMLVTVNSMAEVPGWVNLLASKEEIAQNGSLGYAFTW